MSKGSNQRPKAVDEQTFESNWESTFGIQPQSSFGRVKANPSADESKTNDQQDQ